MKSLMGSLLQERQWRPLAFEEVDYWEELKHIMEYSKTNVTSTLHICWGGGTGWLVLSLWCSKVSP